MADTPTICPYCDSTKTRPLPPTIPDSRVNWLFCDGLQAAVSCAAALRTNRDEAARSAMTESGTFSDH